MLNDSPIFTILPARDPGLGEGFLQREARLGALPSAAYFKDSEGNLLGMIQFD